jgi:predicted phage gp36 major capsid-like protein
VDLWLAEYMLRKGYALMPDRVTPPSEDLQEALKAMSAGGAGTGAEYVPANLASQLWEDFFLASRVASLFTTVEMPTNPFDVPLGLGDTTWRKGSENAATSTSDLATAKTR